MWGVQRMAVVGTLHPEAAGVTLYVQAMEIVAVTINKLVSLLIIIFTESLAAQNCVPQQLQCLCD